MATNEAKVEAKKTTAKAAKAAAVFEPTYTIDELLKAATDFKTNTIVVRAALTKAGKTAYTMKEARELIATMKNKEVKA